MSDGDDTRATVAAWFDRYVDDVHAYAARRVGPELARDVVADTFRIAIEQHRRYDPAQGDVRAWLFGIATNLLRRHWRTESRRLRATARSAGRAATEIDPLLRMVERVDAVRELDALLDEIDALDAGDRDVLVLTAWEDMTSAEVAAVLGIPAGTVRSRLNRIRTRLRASRAPAPAALEADHG